jgi:hypothetical protein
MTIQTTGSHDNKGNGKENEGTVDYEFTNISTQERDGLDRYIQNTLIPAMHLDANDPVNEDDDDDDDVQVPKENVSMAILEDGNGQRGTKRRRAAIQAQRSVQKSNNNSSAMNHEDDEEDDDEYGDGEVSSDDDDDDEEVDSSVNAEIDVEPSDTESDNED